MVIIVIIGMLFVIWLAVAAVPITATTAFAVGEQFTEQEKSDIRQHIPRHCAAMSNSKMG